MAGIGCFKGRNSSSNSATMASGSPDVLANQESVEAQEECSGKKKSKFQTFKKLFARKKRKETAGAEAGMKSSQSSDNVSKTSEEDALNRSEKETGSGSKISLGNKAKSHDSIFVSDSSEVNEPLEASQDSIHGKVKSLQLQLKQAIRLGSPPSLMCVKKMDDAGTTSDEDGLPCSPPDKQSHGSGAVSLEAVGGDDGQFPCASSSRGVSPLVAPGDFSQPASPMACLDNSAAKHKMGLRHKACNRRKPTSRLELRTNGQDVMDGNLDDSVSEPKEEPEEEKTEVIGLEELKLTFTREIEGENDKDEDVTEEQDKEKEEEDEEEEEERSQHSRKSLLEYSKESEEDSQSEEEYISHNPDTSCRPEATEEKSPDLLLLSSSPSSGTSSLDSPRASPEPPAGQREYSLDPLSAAYELLEDKVESALIQGEEEEEEYEETSDKEEEDKEEDKEEDSLLQEVLSSLKTPLVSHPITAQTEDVILEIQETRKEEKEAVELKDQEEEEGKEERSKVEELFCYQGQNIFTKEKEEEEEEEEEGFSLSCQEDSVPTEQETRSDDEADEEREEEEEQEDKEEQFDGPIVGDQEEEVEAAEDEETKEEEQEEEEEEEEEYKPEEKSFTVIGQPDVQAQGVRDEERREVEQEEVVDKLELQKEHEVDEEQESRGMNNEEEEEEVDVQQVTLRVEMEEEMEAEEKEEEEELRERVSDAAEEETDVSVGGADGGEGDDAASETKQGDDEDDDEEEEEILSKPCDESHDEAAEESVEISDEQESEQEVETETQEVDEDECEEDLKNTDQELKQEEEEEETEANDEAVSPVDFPSADSCCVPLSSEGGAVSPPLSPIRSGTTTVHINLVSPSSEKPPPVFQQHPPGGAAESADEDQPVASVVDGGPASVDVTVQQSEQSRTRFTIAPAWQRSQSLTPPSSPPPCLLPASPTAEDKDQELDTTATSAAVEESVGKVEPVISPQVDTVWSPVRARNSGSFSVSPQGSTPSPPSSSKPQISSTVTEESCVSVEGNPESPFGVRLRKISAPHLFSSEEENTEVQSVPESPLQPAAPKADPPQTVAVKPTTNPSVSHRPVVPKKPEMHGDGGGKAKLFPDPAARGSSVGSDSPSWISVAKLKQKIYQEKSLDLTVKEEQEKKPSLPSQASRGQSSKTPESPGKVSLSAVKEVKRDLPPPTPVPAQPTKAHLPPCTVPPKPYVPPSTTKPADQRPRPGPTPVPVPQKPSPCTSPSSPPKPVTTSKPLPAQSVALTPTPFSLVTAQEKSGSRAAASPGRGLTGPALPQDEPPWMALAKKKAKAWSEMPQIVQ